MSAVNNTADIRAMLRFEPNDFYFVQILKRKKDNPDMEKNMTVIKNFYMDSFDDYDKMVPRIIDICDKENARAYFRLNRRNYEHLGLKVISRSVEYLSNKNYRALRNVFDAVAGEFHSDTDKTWIVDLDWSEFIIPEVIVDIKSTIRELQIQAKKEPRIDVLPTKNGLHLITRPFNKKVFKDKYPMVDIHTDNPTILYCP